MARELSEYSFIEIESEYFLRKGMNLVRWFLKEDLTRDDYAEYIERFQSRNPNAGNNEAGYEDIAKQYISDRLVMRADPNNRCKKAHSLRDEALLEIETNWDKRSVDTDGIVDYLATYAEELG